MGLIGKKVMHKSSYGMGVIISQDDFGIIDVKFDGLSEIKSFSAPTCFNKYLELIDQDLEQSQKNSEESSINSYTTIKRKSYFTTTTGNPTPVPVEDFFVQQEKVLKSEMAYLGKNGGKRIRIFDGKLIESKPGKYIYSFETDSELNLPDNTQISLWIDSFNDSIDAAIIDCEDFTVIISSTRNLGESVQTCEFSSETWRLLGCLIDRLQILRTEPSEIVTKLISERHRRLSFKGSISTGQDTACKMSFSQPITFIWGPPGTGKTETLANIVKLHLEKGNRILMLSYSNVSVDGALWRVFDKTKKLKPGELVRYGYPRSKELLQHEYLTSYNLALLKQKTLLQERNNLVNERHNLSRTSPRYVEIGRRLTEIRKKIQNEEKQTVRNAKFVATTVAKVIVDSVLCETPFDTVIFDEASMAYVPQIIFSAGLAKKHFICLGDFSQLPPIVQSDNTNSLNTDIFQFCGITDAVKAGVGHEWLCMLNVQYRMHPDIAQFASRTMYRNLLHSDESMLQKRTEIANCRPFLGNALHLADLSGMLSVCTKTADQSRVNILSAFISISLAIVAAEKHEVAIITPYNSQSRLLHAFSKDVAEQFPELSKITASTVHQFQGAEKEIVIYDAVDCYRMKYPGAMLSSSTNNYSNRLYNVAVTRAKGKMVSVVNVNYLKTKKYSEKFVFRKMIDTLSTEKKTTYGNKLIDECENKAVVSYSQENAENIFLKDISKAKKEIVIDMPGGSVSSINWLVQLSELLSVSKKKGIKVVIRTDSKHGLPNEIKSIVIENKFVANPIAIIDKEIVWYGMPMSNAVFTTEGHKIPTNYKPIFRFYGKRTARTIYGFLEMNKTIDSSVETINIESGDSYNSFAAFVAGEIRCKECGGAMRLKKSKRGKFFLACSNYPKCENTQFVDPEMLDKYFYFNNPNGKRCPQDNKSLTAKIGRYGLYVCCCALNTHYFKLDEI